MARQHTTLIAVRDNQEALRQMVADLRQVLTEGQHLEYDAQRNSPFALLSRLAAGLAHDLRNLLGAIFLEEWHQYDGDVGREQYNFPTKEDLAI